METLLPLGNLIVPPCDAEIILLTSSSQCVGRGLGVGVGLVDCAPETLFLSADRLWISANDVANSVARIAMVVFRGFMCVDSASFALHAAIKMI